MTTGQHLPRLDLVPEGWTPTILIDSREQDPLPFTYPTSTTGLPTGDYRWGFRDRRRGFRTKCAYARTREGLFALMHGMVGRGEIGMGERKRRTFMLPQQAITGFRGTL
jgi:hypothetical protein